ncbi:pilus assembly protein TadG-related protein [Streptomyces sp. NPDC021020]|uniref:pilus assembly protein TadG-related protein n=1 Tax=Streptomyces sp. NPDC021020 TaxID=3365109 RepID=UPI0037AE4520
MGIYIVAMAALFFLAFAYFAVGQASVTRGQAQTAADAAALAAARADRDALRDDFLQAVTAGDVDALTGLLANLGQHDAAACAAAAGYADRNGAEIPPGGCVPADDGDGYTVTVRSRDAVGKSAVDGTEEIHAKATATAVVEPRCVVGPKEGQVLGFTCDHRDVTIDPTSAGFRLDLSTFYTVHLSQ